MISIKVIIITVVWVLITLALQIYLFMRDEGEVCFIISRRKIIVNPTTTNIIGNNILTPLLFL
jgi:hypothetical protein